MGCLSKILRQIGPTTGSKSILDYKLRSKKKYRIDPTQSPLRFHPSDMLQEINLAQPHPWGACAIGSNLFVAILLAFVLLIWRCSRAIPTPILVLLCIFGSSKQLMNLPNQLRLLPFLLHNPPVSNQLPCQQPTKFKKSWTPFNLPIPKGKEPKSKEIIDLRDCQQEGKHPNLPPHRHPAVLNRWHHMA